MYELKNHIAAPDHLVQMFDSTNSIHSYNLRNSKHNLFVRRPYTENQSKVMKVKLLKVARKNKNVSGLMLKYANCTTQVKFLSIFVQFCGVASVAK